MKRMYPVLLAVAHLMIAGASSAQTESGWPEPVKAPANAPNIVVVLLDDVGFAASSTFGGPSQTPALQALADNGLRYNNFNVTALCSPTRAALLSGRNAQRVGFGTVAELARAQTGYNSVWPDNAATLAEVLNENGYSTAAFGKWHNTPAWEVSAIGPFDRWPTGMGFDYFYGFMEGETSQWEPVLYQNTHSVERPSGDDYYFPTDMTDQTISWLRTQRSIAPDTPYFLYYSTGSTHVPHHVPEEWIEQYRGQFDEGWDVLRQRIFEQQKASGVIPADTELPERLDAIPEWDNLTSDQRKIAARQMEVYAAFLAQTDHEIGRLIDSVRSLPGGDNTLIFYIVGDNGADALGGVSGSDFSVAQSLFRISPPESDRLEYLDELGGVEFDNAYSSGWAWALSTPFRGAKGDAAHFGGTRVGMVVSWPEGISEVGGLRTQFTAVTDIASTVYEVAGIESPTIVDGETQLSLDGQSFAYTFNDAQQTAPSRVQFFETMGNRAIYQDGWVAAAKHWLPWDGGLPGLDFDAATWELYNVNEDFSQANDLAATEPERLQQLRQLFDSEAERNQVYPLGNALTGLMGHRGPSLVEGRTTFTYFPSGQSYPMHAAPSLTRSHKITIDLVIPDEENVDGTILSIGSRYGGVSIYAEQGYIVYANNYFGMKHDTLKASHPLPSGEVTVEFTLENDRVLGGSGTGTLLVNGEEVAQGYFDKIGWPPGMFGALDIGETHVSPVSKAYDVPFAFTGEIKEVTIELTR